MSFRGGRTVSNPLPEGYEEQFFSNNAEKGPDISEYIASSAASTSGDAATNAVSGIYEGCFHAAGESVAVLAAKTTLAKVGLFSTAFFANDIYEDFRDYNGWDTTFAMMLDFAGLLAGIFAGAGIAALTATAGVAPIIVLGATFVTGAVISFGIDSAKSALLCKRKKG